MFPYITEGGHFSTADYAYPILPNPQKHSDAYGRQLESAVAMENNGLRRKYSPEKETKQTQIEFQTGGGNNGNEELPDYPDSKQRPNPEERLVQVWTP